MHMPRINTRSHYTMGNSDSRALFSDKLSSIGSTHEIDRQELNALFSVPVSIEDIYEIMTPDVIRDWRAKQPGRLIGLIGESVRILYDMYDKSLQRPLVAAVDRVSLMNAVRILTRIAPFINDDNNADEFLSLLWMSPQEPTSIDGANPESVGFRIVGAILRSAFIRGFSIPASCSIPSGSVDPNRLEPNLVWGRAGGIAGLPVSRLTYSASSQMIESRTEIVRLILTVLSRPLFQSMAEYRGTVPIFNSLICSGDFVHTANLFVSLLITVLEYETSRMAIPILSNQLGSTEDGSADEQLVSACLNLINVLVDLPSRGEDLNVFREILTSGIAEKEELVTLTKMLANKVVSLYQTNVNLSLSLTVRMRNTNGFVLFLFNLLNMAGHAVVDEIRRQWGKELILAMLAVLAVHVQDPSSVGLVHTCSFILLKLSGEREFVIDVMAKPYNGEIDAHLTELKMGEPQEAFKISDLVFVLLHKLILNKSKFVSESLIEMWLTICCNISPFVPGLNVDAASLVVSLLDRMSRAGWLLGNPARHHSAAFLLELVGNGLQYQYDSNFNLVYSLLLSAPKIIMNFETLSVESPGFKPSVEWLTDVKAKFAPGLDTIRRLVNYLGPRIAETCTLNEGDVDHRQVVALIKRMSVVGILPVPHAIVVRQYQPNEQTRLWFTSYLWGVIFTSLQTMPILDWQRVKMVTLGSARQVSQEATEEQATS